MLPVRCCIKAPRRPRPALAVGASLYLFCSLVTSGQLGAAPNAENTTPTAAAVQAASAKPQPAVDENHPVETDDEAAAQRRFDLYSQRVDKLHSEFGAYNIQFAEALLDLGLAQQQLGQHDDAIKTLKQALHVNRINGGLYNPGVAPILERLIFSHASIGEWEEVDDRHHFLMQLSLQTLQPDDPALLPVLFKLSRWHLYAFDKNIDANPLQHLVAARGLFNRAASIIEVNFGNADLRLADQYRGRAIADYYLALYQQSEPISFDMGSNEEDEKFRRVIQIQGGFGEGLRAIKSSIAVYANNENAPQEAHALALTQLGDWYLMFRKRQSANAAYSQAYAMLAAKPELASILKSTFGRPVALPDFNNAYFDYFDDSKKQRDMGYVLVNVDVTASGATRRAEVIDASAAKKSMRRRALASLKTTIFRPRFKNGVAVATEGLRYRYRFTIDPKKTAKKG